MQNGSLDPSQTVVQMQARCACAVELCHCVVDGRCGWLRALAAAALFFAMPDRKAKENVCLHFDRRCFCGGRFVDLVIEYGQMHKSA